MMVPAAVQIWSDRLKQGRATGLNVPLTYLGTVLQRIKFGLQTKIICIEFIN